MLLRGVSWTLPLFRQGVVGVKSRAFFAPQENFLPLFIGECENTNTSTKPVRQVFKLVWRTGLNLNYRNPVWGGEEKNGWRKEWVQANKQVKNVVITVNGICFTLWCALACKRLYVDTSGLVRFLNSGSFSFCCALRFEVSQLGTADKTSGQHCRMGRRL